MRYSWRTLLSTLCVASKRFHFNCPEGPPKGNGWRAHGESGQNHHAKRVPCWSIMAAVKVIKDRQEKRALLDALNQEPKKKALWWEYKERTLQDWLAHSADDLCVEVRF